MTSSNGMSKRKERMIEALLPGIRAQAYKRSRNRMQAEDMAQEAVAVVLVAYKQYRTKKDKDLITILGAVARNAIIDVQRQSISDGRVLLIEDTDTMDALAGSHRFPHHGDETEAADLLIVIKSRLSKEARLVLEERINPSDKTERIIEKENKRREHEKRERGFFTVRITRITDSVISQSLKIPKRRVSRASREIKIVVVNALKGN